MADVRDRYSPLIHTYLKKYQNDPSSRIFAPLAEAYRKAGLTDEAIEIAREGLRVHPTFIGGRVALARALFDQKKYDEVISELSEIVRDVPDNLVAQRLMAESCLMIGRVADALSAYKMLLYFNPASTETADIVKELESQAYKKGTLVLQEARSGAGEVESLAEVKIHPAGAVISEDPDVRRSEWIRRIQLLQGMLQNVERYRNA